MPLRTKLVPRVAPGDAGRSRAFIDQVRDFLASGGLIEEAAGSLIAPATTLMATVTNSGR